MRELELLVLQGPRMDITVRWSPEPAIDYRDPPYDLQLSAPRVSGGELGTVLVAVPGSHRRSSTCTGAPTRPEPLRSRG
jgi:hypothetical protein